MVGPFGWDKLPPTLWPYVQTKLSDFESMTWNQILIEGKKQHHSSEVYKLSKEAQKRLAEIQQDDVDSLISLSLAGKERVWGILEEGALKILWWDPNHKVYPSKKKHT
jgi:hypothetical protein